MPVRKARMKTIPRLWLMTDERVDDARLIAAAGRLPRGSAIIVRHYLTEAAARRALFARLRAIARRRGLMLLLAGDAAQARRWGADGVHGHDVGGRRAGLLHSAPAHDMRELRRARMAGADAVLVSPVFPTRSHPGAVTLGPMRLATIFRHASVPVIALGGMSARRARQLRGIGIHGWAAIDALS